LSEEEIKWEPIIFPYISRTFVSRGIIHLERRMPMKEITEEMLGNLNINTISEEGSREGNFVEHLPLCTWKCSEQLDCRRDSYNF